MRITSHGIRNTAMPFTTPLKKGLIFMRFDFYCITEMAFLQKEFSAGIPSESAVP
jgi:hypothetical protein